MSPARNFNSGTTLSVEMAELRAESRTALRMGLADAHRHTELVRRELHGRIARLERSRKPDMIDKAMEHIPWVKIMVLLILCVFLVAGNITAPELKQLLLNIVERAI
jgi:hypothetical protein